MAMAEEKRAEREERRAEREAEERKAERERRFEREFELRKMEHEQSKSLNEMTMIEMKAMREEDVEVMEDGSQSGEVEAPKKGYGHNLHKHVEEEQLAYRTKKYGDSMRHVLPKCPLKTRSFLNFLRLWKSFLRYTKFLTISKQNC